MLYSNTLRTLNRLGRQFCRHAMSSTAGNSLVTSKIDRQSGVAVLSMNKKPVNSIDRTLLSQLIDEIKKLENDPSCRALVFTSATPRVFSAGIEFTEFLDDFPSKFRAHWSLFQDAFLAMHKTRLFTIAAVNGHAPAGGCVFAMAADYRIMAKGSFTIGLNESQIDLIVPFWICDRFRQIVGTRQAEMHLQLGTLFTPQQALSVGLVDELCEENDLLEKSKSEAGKWLKIQDGTRCALKDHHTQELCYAMEKQKREDIEFMVNSVAREECQQSIKAILDRLKKK